MTVAAGFTHTHTIFQSDTEALGTAVDLGNYGMHPLIGLLHDAVGPAFASVVAACLAGVGYLGVSLCVGPHGTMGVPSTASIDALGASLFSVGFGGGLGCVSLAV